jgi:hypothetical protein
MFDITLSGHREAADLTRQLTPYTDGLHDSKSIKLNGSYDFCPPEKRKDIYDAARELQQEMLGMSDSEMRELMLQPELKHEYLITLPKIITVFRDPKSESKPYKPSWRK